MRRLIWSGMLWVEPNMDWSTLDWPHTWDCPRNSHGLLVHFFRTDGLFFWKLLIEQAIPGIIGTIFRFLSLFSITTKPKEDRRRWRLEAVQVRMKIKNSSPNLSFRRLHPSSLVPDFYLSGTQPLLEESRKRLIFFIENFDPHASFHS